MTHFEACLFALMYAFKVRVKTVFPIANYVFKVKNGNTKKGVNYSKLRIKTPERRMASSKCLYCQF